MDWRQPVGRLCEGLRTVARAVGGRAWSAWGRLPQKTGRRQGPGCVRADVFSPTGRTPEACAGQGEASLTLTRNTPWGSRRTAS